MGVATLPPKPPLKKKRNHVRIIGIGGAGIEIVNHIVNETLMGIKLRTTNPYSPRPLGEGTGIRLITIDSCSLLSTSSPQWTHLLIGEQVTHGQGTGGDRKIGKRCAEASSEAIQRALTGADTVFIVGGMGGGIASGTAPVVARIARDDGATNIIGVFSTPFFFEGSRRRECSEEGIKIFKEYVDSLEVVTSDELLELMYVKMPHASLNDAFAFICKIIAWRVAAQLLVKEL
jgi:cell division protein FtsZ